MADLTMQATVRFKLEFKNAEEIDDVINLFTRAKATAKFPFVWADQREVFEKREE